MYGEIRMSGQVRHQVAKPRHCDDRNAVIALNFLYGRQIALPAFLAVERDQYAGRRGPGCPNQLNRFAYGGAGRNDVIDNQDATGKRCADDIATLAMILGFFTIKGKMKVPSVPGECDSDGSNERDAFVGRPEQHVKPEICGIGCFGVEFRQSPKRLPIVEQPGIKKVRRESSGLGFELAEAQNLAIYSEFDEILSKIHIFPLSGGREISTDFSTMLRIISLNLNGIRSAWNKNVLPWAVAQQADIVCLQELKAQQADLNSEMQAPDGMHAYYHCAAKRGYSGVGIWSRMKPDRVIEGFDGGEFDAEGRYIRADFGGLTVVSLYLPSGSSSPERQEAKFRFLDAFFPHMHSLRAEGRDIVLCGDWNIAHQPIDLKNWKSNQKNSGFLPEERAWLSKLFDEQGWVDVYRHLYPEAGDECYTWWSNRGQAWAKNVGWRIDYQIATPEIARTAVAASIYKNERFSDHAPLIVDYDVR